MLLGYCFGGMVALEMTRQLEAAGEPPGALVIVDGHPPGVDDGYLEQHDFILDQLRQLGVDAADGRWLAALAPDDVDAQLDAICARIAWSGFDDAARAALVRRLREGLGWNLAKNAYRPDAPVASRTWLVRIDAPAFHRESNAVPDLGWNAFTRSPVVLSWIGGDHAHALSSDNLPVIGAAIAAAADHCHPTTKDTR
jgi:thioesterase domain-containing protein